jgi:thiamine transport system ATP-binding protein
MSRLLDVAGLRVAYGDHVAVDDFDLSVDDGEIVALLGPSGCGKTTVLRAISGLEPLAAGRVVVDGADLAGVPPHRRRVGLMFQDHALFPHRDVAGNVGFGLRMAGVPGDARRRRVSEVLELVGLDGFAARPVTSLSGGEQQRVALARALAPAPRLLLLDEPLGALDRSLRQQLVGELRALFSELSITAVVVTHDQAEAFSLAGRVVLLRAGRVVQEGEPAAVWAYPADADVARFLGVDVVPVTVSDGAAATPFGLVRAPGLGDGPAGLVVRPDAVAVAAGPDGGLGGALGGVVVATAFRGEHFVVRVATEVGPVLDVQVRAEVVPKIGDRVGLALRPDRLVVVPMATA